MFLTKRRPDVKINTAIKTSSEFANSIVSIIYIRIMPASDISTDRLRNALRRRAEALRENERILLGKEETVGKRGDC